MKIFLIYKIDRESSIEPHLYAYTTKKYIKDCFIEERKKDMFYVKEREMTDEEYKELKKKHGNYRLGRRGFKTKPSSPDSFAKYDKIYITATEFEEMDIVVKSDNVIFEVGKHTGKYAEAFNEKLINALNTLYYFQIYKFCNMDEYNPFTETTKPFDMIKDNVIPDEFSIFLYLYGNTLDVKYILKKK